MLNVKRFKKIYKLTPALQRKLLSSILILFLTLNNALVPLSFVVNSQTTTTDFQDLFTNLEEPIISFSYQTSDEFTPHSDEYVNTIRNALSGLEGSSVTLPEGPTSVTSGGSSFIGPHEAGNSPSIEGIIDGLPMVIILRAGEVTDGNLARTWTETKDKYQNANPLIVRIGEVTFNTTIRQAEQTANAIVQMGFPEGTIVVYGNELNNLYKEWGSRSSPPEAPATSSELIKAAEEYAGLFKAFADITQPSGLKAAVAPVDLYNYYFPPDKWMQTVGDMGSYDLALATVANAYDTYRVTSGGTDGPGIDTVLDAIKNIEEKTGKPVDFLTEIGPHPDESIQAHIDYLNTVAQPTNSAGFPLKASTLIENKCNNSTTDDSSNSWLFYVKGKVFDKAGREVDATSCVTSLSTEYDAVTLSGMVVSGMAMDIGEGYYETTPGLEGYVLATYEVIDFETTSYFNWTHATTTNKNGKFAIPIDKRSNGVFLVVLKPEPTGLFEFVQSYEVSSFLPQEQDRRPENSLVIVAQEAVSNPQTIEYYKDNLPEFVNLYSLNYDNPESNFYMCSDKGNIEWSSFERQANIPLEFIDSPFDDNLEDNVLNTFELEGNTRSLECILDNPLNDGEELEFGTREYVERYEDYYCWGEKDPFLPINSNYLYTNREVKEGLTNLSYLKGYSDSSSFYNGPINLLKPTQANKNLGPVSCHEFESSSMIKTEDPNKNIYTFAGFSALEYPQSTKNKVNIGSIDPLILKRVACTDNGTDVNYEELLEKGYEFNSQFHTDQYLGPGGNTTYTNVSTLVTNDNVYNNKPNPQQASLYEDGRDSPFVVDKKAISMAALESTVSDVYLENTLIYGDYGRVRDDQKPSGSYNNFLYPYADKSPENIFIYEIGPQRSLCEVTTMINDENGKNVIENSRVLLEPISRTPNPEETDRWGDAGWILDNKNSIDNDNCYMTNTNSCSKGQLQPLNFFEEQIIDTYFKKIIDALSLKFSQFLKPKDDNTIAKLQGCVDGKWIEIDEGKYNYLKEKFCSGEECASDLFKSSFSEEKNKIIYEKRIEIKYICEGEGELGLDIRSIKETDSRPLSYQENRSLNQNSILITDVFKIPNTSEEFRPYNIGKKRVDLYSVLERPTEDTEESDLFAKLVDSIFGSKEIENEEKIFNKIELITEDAEVTVEPASANINWLRQAVNLPDGTFRERVTNYNEGIYRKLDRDKRLENRNYLNVGRYEGSGPIEDEDSFEQPRLVGPNPDRTVPGGCPVTCDPIVTCWAYDSSGGSCRHGRVGESYWGNRDVCSWPIPAYKFPNTLPIFHPSCRGENIEPSSQYGWALDVKGSTCNLVTAPQIKNIRDWTVARVKLDGNDSYVMITGNGTGGTYYMNLHHLRSETIRSNIIEGATLTPGAIIAEYYDHVHIEMAVNGSYIKPEDHLWGCYSGEGSGGGGGWR